MSDDPPRTVGAALQAARRAGMERLDAQWLLSAALDRPRAWLLAHPEAPIGTDQAMTWQGWLARHAQGEPLAYLLGWTEFFGLRLQVSPAVLIPRPDTEVLVRWGLQLLTRCPAPASVLDLGTGSGAIALALKHHAPSVGMTAVDASVPALGVARENGRRLGLEVTWLTGDWWSAAAHHGPFHLAVSNPPYVEQGDPHLAALRHEPLSALTAGADGLDDLRRIVAGAPAHLAPGGWLLLEHGWTQHESVAHLLKEAGFDRVETRPDLGGRPRCTGGVWHADAGALPARAADRTHRR